MNVPKANDNGEEEIDGSSMDQSNSSGSRPTDQSTSSGVNREQDAAAEIAARENRVVAFGRRCMIALLLVVAAGASVAVYKFTAKEQEKEFKRSVSLLFGTRLGSLNFFLISNSPLIV